MDWSVSLFEEHDVLVYILPVRVYLDRIVADQEVYFPTINQPTVPERNL